MSLITCKDLTLAYDSGQVLARPGQGKYVERYFRSAT